jgi:hypothetical protein
MRLHPSRTSLRGIGALLAVLLLATLLRTANLLAVLPLAVVLLTVLLLAVLLLAVVLLAVVLQAACLLLTACFHRELIGIFSKLNLDTAVPIILLKSADWWSSSLRPESGDLFMELLWAASLAQHTDFKLVELMAVLVCAQDLGPGVMIKFTRRCLSMFPSADVTVVQ